MNDMTMLMKKLDLIEPLFSAAGDPQLETMAKFLAERISSPESFVTFLGETSSGKTTLINGLIGKPLLPVKAAPTTGTISEVIFDSNQQEDRFFAINKNATIEEIDQVTCTSLIEKPDKNLSRVRIITQSPFINLKNMRVFDTPGYDSIISEHEEILKEFLPNSDVVIYTVSYKIGIQESDYAFLGFLRELLREDADILIVINRCPAGITENNLRIREIKQYASDILQLNPKCYLVQSIITDGDDYPLPLPKTLWNNVSELVNSEKRMKALYEAFDAYIDELYQASSELIQMQYAAMMMSEEEYQKIDAEQKATAERIRKAIDEIVVPGFDNIRTQLPGKMKYSADRAEELIIDEIKEAPTGKMDEMIAYTNAHLLPYYIKQESKEIQLFMKTYLDDINDRVDDYLNKELIEFNSKISIVVSTNKELAAKNIVGKVTNRAGYHMLLNYFKTFGGAGGANAGIANAASHLLKKFGDMFGKTFSRNTHNTLKHALAKIGATSMKAVGVALSIIIELGMVSLDYATWKAKLIPKVKKAIKAWEKETTPTLLSDLEALKINNIETIQQIATDIEHTFDSEMCNNRRSRNDLEELIKRCNEIGKQIGVK